MDSEVQESGTKTHERNSSELSHLDTGEGNSVATGQIEVLDRDTSHALTVRAAFDPLSAMADEWMERARLIHVTDIGQVEDMAFARESRLGLRKVRSKVEHLRAEMKEDLVKRGKDIDGTATALKDKILPVEAHLREQEEFAIRYEAARRAELHASRSAQLVALGADPKAYAFADASDEGFASILNIARAVRDVHLEADRLAEVARLEAERIAAAAQEADRLERVRQDAERAERERLQAEENARLKVEAVEREKVVEAERAERARLDAIREEALRVEREAAAAIAKAEREERDRERQRAEAQARIEREKIEAVARKAREENDALLRRLAEAERVEREKAEALAREAKAKADREAEVARQAALAPDREKLERLSLDLQALARGEQVTIVIPVMATDAGRAALARILVNFGRLANSIVKEAGGL